MLERASDALRHAQRVVVFTGAGISAESGVPTFRDALTGLWERYDPQALATPQAFQRDPTSRHPERRCLVCDAPGATAGPPRRRSAGGLAVRPPRCTCGGLVRSGRSRAAAPRRGRLAR